MKTFKQYLLENSLMEAEIKSESQFKEWLFNLYKKAHGDGFDEEIAQKVYDDLMQDYDEETGFGELMGRATSGLGN